MQAYKLTTQDNTTRNNTWWGENVTHETSGEGSLCGPGWLHFYSNPHLALLLNPNHADIYDPKLWVAEAEGEFKHDRGLKSGCTKLTTIQEIDVPVISYEQKVFFAISCAQKVCEDKAWNEWAINWINNIDRSKDTANSIANIVVGIIGNIRYVDSVNDRFDRFNAAYAAFYAVKGAAEKSLYKTAYAVEDASKVITIDFEVVTKEMLSFQG